MSSPDGSGPIEWVRWFLTTGEGPAAYIRNVLKSAGAVLLVGLLLFGVSGVWPPLVAVESGSMNPHLQKGDLVFVMEEHRFAPEETYEQTGVVTTDIAEEIGYQEFSQSGDVIVYRPDGNEGRTPIILKRGSSCLSCITADKQRAGQKAGGSILDFGYQYGHKIES